MRDRDSVFPPPRWVHLPEWATGTPCTRCGGCGCGMEPPWLAEELRGMGGAEGEGERLGQGPGVVMPTASSSGLGCWLLPYFRSFQVIPGPAGSPTCLLPAAGSYANACYLSPRWAGPEEFSVAARAQPGMCGRGPGAPGLVGERPGHSSFPGEAGTG